MQFRDFIEVGAINANLAAEGKEAAIEELIGCLVAAGGIQADEQKSIVDAVMKREELGSTGIGRGVAVPHTKHPSVDRLIGTVGISHDGVDFNSLDGEKVQIFFLLVSLRIGPVTTCERWRASRVNCETTLSVVSCGKRNRLMTSSYS